MSHGIVTLALELSQHVGSVALSNESGECITALIDVGRREHDDVMPTIATLAEDLSVSPQLIKLVVLSIGPGGFTGLRTSVAIAKMVSLVSGAKIVAIESAITTVVSSEPQPGSYFVISGVKQDSFWLSKVTPGGEFWQCNSGLSSLEEFQSRLGEVEGVFGDTYAPEIVSELCASSDTPFLPVAPTATSLLHLGQKYFQKGVFTNPLALVPLYPREPEAVRLWKNKHGSDKTT
jgi:tRNA threonylcarbamoyl adenosine modification protein YeaZ